MVALWASVYLGEMVDRDVSSMTPEELADEIVAAGAMPPNCDQALLRATLIDVLRHWRETE
jgi:hypothetical protein